MVVYKVYNNTIIKNVISFSFQLFLSRNAHVQSIQQYKYHSSFSFQMIFQIPFNTPNFMYNIKKWSFTMAIYSVYNIHKSRLEVILSLGIGDIQCVQHIQVMT